MCDDCSASSSSSSSHDPQLFKWMTEIGIVKDDAEEGDAKKRCSCCDGVINNPISKVSSLDFEIKERELLGCDFSDQKVQENSEQFDDSTFGYQVLGSGAEEEEEEEQSEEDAILEAEKEPLLQNINDNNGKNKEIVNLCPDMLPQHLEFYIDHDDYRLIPVELVDDNSIKVGGEEEKTEISEISREFELVFEGFELVLPRCEVTPPSKDLPSIQEEEESETENLPLLKDEEKIVGSNKFELVFEGNELVEVCEIISENLPKEEERETENLEIREIEEEQEEEEQEDSDRILQFLQEQEKEREIENSHFLEEQKEETAIDESTPILDEQESKNQAIEADSQATAETHSTPSVSDEDNASHLKKEETDTEEKNQIATDKLLIQESKEDIASHLRSHEIEIETETEISQNLTDNLLIQESTEDTSSHLRNNEIKTESETETERKQNQTADELLIVVDEPPTHCKQESQTTADNVVSEVSTSCSQEAEISERSLNANVGMTHNEVEEEKVPDTPTSSESLSHLHRKLSFLGRTESATEESLDGMSMISEQESMETMEKLKLDLLAERKALRTLYKELEEERNASAIAANQTMAMITRLQEEKASMQMEALQYQRMMEEQSEYDQEALQMMNELVVKREKEKQELEKELEVYRKKVVDYEEREKMRMLCRRRSRNSSASCSYGEESDGLSIDLNQEVKEQEEDGGGGVSPHCQEENGHQDTPTDAVLCLQDSLSGFEEERQAILEQLKVLEEKLFTLAEEEEEHFENMKPFEQFYEENGKDFDVSNGDDNNNGFIVHTNGKHQQERRMMINGSMPKRLLPLFDAADQLLESPNGEEFNGNEDDNEFHLTKFELEKKRFAIEEEVDHVYERLQALEADREFLKHCMGSLRKGEKGLDLLQEILQHLRDLKNVELQAMKNTDQCASV